MDAKRRAMVVGDLAVLLVAFIWGLTNVVIRDALDGITPFWFCFLRFVVHYISGVTIYAITMPTELFGSVYTSPAMYSLIYNGSYMLIDTIICLVVFGVLYRPLDKYLQARDIIRR